MITARAVQSLGGAIQYPAGLALLLSVFPIEKRQFAIGIWGAMGALAAAVGPSFGALLVELLGWRSIFAINVPIALVALTAGKFWLEESFGQVPEGRVDMIGVPLASFGVGAIVLGIVQANEWGPGSPAQLITIAAGIVLVGAFVVRSRNHPAPLFDLALLKMRSFSSANLGMTAFTLAFFSWLVTLPTFLQDQWDWSVLQAGIAIAPGPLVAMLVSPSFGKLADRIGPAPILMAGGLAGAIGLLLQRVFVTLEPNYVLMILLPSLFIGVAAGASFAMSVAAALRDVPPTQFGMAGAARTTIFSLAVAVGIALGFAFTAGADTAQEALDGLQWLWLVCAGLYFAEFLIFWRMYPRYVPPARTVSQTTT